MKMFVEGGKVGRKYVSKRKKKQKEERNEQGNIGEIIKWQKYIHL